MKRIAFFLSVLFMGCFLNFAVEAKLPELIVEEIRIKPVPITQESDVTLTVTVENFSYASSPATKLKIKIIKDGKVIYKRLEDVPPLVDSGEMGFVYDLGKEWLGNYKVIAVVDPYNNVKEKNEINNKCTKKFSSLPSSYKIGQSAGSAIASMFFTTEMNMQLWDLVISSLSKFDPNLFENEGVLKLNETTNKLGLKGYAFPSCSKSGSIEMTPQFDSEGRIVCLDLNFNSAEDWIDDQKENYARINGPLHISLTYYDGYPDSIDLNIKAGGDDSNGDALTIENWRTNSNEPDKINLFNCEMNKVDYFIPDYEFSAFNNSGTLKMVDNKNDWAMATKIDSADFDFQLKPGLFFGLEYGNLEIDDSTGTKYQSISSIECPGFSFHTVDGGIQAYFDGYDPYEDTGEFSINSPCINWAFEAQTDSLQPLTFPMWSDRPTSGKILVSQASINFLSDGGITIDENGDGVVDVSFSSLEELAKKPCPD